MWVRNRTAFSKPAAATIEQTPDMDLTEATMKRLAAKIVQLEELKAGRSCRGLAHAAPMMRAQNSSQQMLEHWHAEETTT